MNVMKTVDLIRKKRDGGKLTREEIEFLIEGYIKGEIPDYQVSALLMAIYFRSMDDEETAILTDVMAHSGRCSTYPIFPATRSTSTQPAG